MWSHACTAKVLVGICFLCTAVSRPDAQATDSARSRPLRQYDAAAAGLPASVVWRTDGMTGLLVPGGEFIMGSAQDDPTAEDQEKPVHRVYVSSFWIDRTEVTNAMFERFVVATSWETVAEQVGYSHGFVSGHFVAIEGANWRHPAGRDSTIDDLKDHPVVAVGWRDADAYCRWAGRRLPTEAEWEKAARGTDGRRYPWGDVPPDSSRANLADRTTGLPWAELDIDDGFQRTSPVGWFIAGASPYGALDMAGNVWEWVADWYDPFAYSNPRHRRDPQGPEQGDAHVIRGGCFDDDARHVRAARRTRDDWGYTSIEGGFRCAAGGYVILPYVHRASVALQQDRAATTPLPSGTSALPTSVRAYLPHVDRPRPTTLPTATPVPDICLPLGRHDYGTLSINGPPSRPADSHPDLNLAIRGYSPTSAPLALVDYGGGTDPRAPKLWGLLGRLPAFVGAYQVNHWDWSRGVRGSPINDWPVTLLGLQSVPGEPVSIPESGYSIGDGYAVLVLYASDTRITIKYTREDDVVRGYTLHLERVCVDPALRELYDDMVRRGRRHLPALRHRQAFATARSIELLVAVRDSGRFMDPRSRKDWWPGLAHPAAAALSSCRFHNTHEIRPPTASGLHGP